MSKRIIISGGGTGGHVFPAISIANALKDIDSDMNILFVGALGRLEMKKVPEAGYDITGLPVAGFERKLSLRNITVIVKLLRSMVRAGRIIRVFKPDVVVGVGGYASGPMLRVAGRKGIPTLIQEQNSYAGLTNRLLSKLARKICVAYDGMEKYFPKDKIIHTGNPIRKDLHELAGKKEEGYKYFGLNGENEVLLVLGGSGGSRTINESILSGLEAFEMRGLAVIWQTGKYYYDEMLSEYKKHDYKLTQVHGFIDRMDLAYAVADIIVSRAGAGTISELSVVGKPAILIPSPNVAEDHQKKNALALVRNEAAIMINDNESVKKLSPAINELINDKERRKRLSDNISAMAIKNSDILIANEILKLAE